MPGGLSYKRINDDAYNKLLFQARSQFGAILNVFRCYGMSVDVDEAINECVELTENFGMAVRGKESPIHILREAKERATE